MPQALADPIVERFGLIPLGSTVHDPVAERFGLEPLTSETDDPIAPIVARPRHPVMAAEVVDQSPATITDAEDPFHPQFFRDDQVRERIRQSLDPIEGVKKVVKGAAALGKIQDTAEQAGDISGTETAAAANDLIEGIFQASGPLIAGGLVKQPVQTALALIKAGVAAKVSETAASYLTDIPAVQRLAGNLGAALSGGFSVRDFVRKNLSDASEVLRQAKAFDAAHPEPVAPTEPTPVGRGRTEGARAAGPRLEADNAPQGRAEPTTGPPPPDPVAESLGLEPVVTQMEGAGPEFQALSRPDVGTEKTLGPSSLHGKSSVGGTEKDGFASNIVGEPVISRAEDLKVLDPIIRAIPVDVVNMLGGQEWAAQVLLHNPSMLTRLIDTRPDVDVAAFSERALPDIARLRAELRANGVTPTGTKYESALDTLDSHLREASAAAQADSSSEPSEMGLRGTDPRTEFAGPSTGGSEDGATTITREVDQRHGQIVAPSTTVNTSGSATLQESHVQDQGQPLPGGVGAVSAGRPDAPGGDQGRPAPAAPVKESLAAKRTRLKALRDEYAAAVAAAPKEVFDSIVARAREQGFEGDEAPLREDLANRFAAFEEFEQEFHGADYAPEHLLKTIASYGGLSIEAESAQKEELHDLALVDTTNATGQHPAFGRVGGVQGVINLKKGLSLDGMLEALGQNPEFAHLTDFEHLKAAIRDAATAKAPVGLPVDRFKRSLSQDWWQRLTPEPTDDFESELADLRGESGDDFVDAEGNPKFATRKGAPQTPGLFSDTLDTGEEQPRLPGAEDVRDQDVAQPEFEAPFSLTSEAVQRKGVTPSLFGDEKPKFSKADLIIQHNISARKLAHALKLGGIPVPSLAITRHDQGITGFGEITLIGPRQMAEPSKDTKVFGADVYAPRYPTVHYKIPPSGEKILSTLWKAWKDQTGESYYDLDSLQKEGAQYLRHSGPVLGAFLKEQDLTIPASVPDEGKYAREGQIDTFQTRYAYEEAIRTKGLQDTFEQYAERMFDSLSPTEHIYKGFTNAGNRSYTPHTLENVVRELKKNLRGGESQSNLYGPGQLRAKFTPRFTSVAQIRKAKGTLVSHEYFEKVREEVNEHLFKVGNILKPYYAHDAERFGFIDTVMAVMEDGARTGLVKALKEYGFEDVPANTLQDIRTFMASLTTLPTEYFEAKKLRAVGLNEFSAAVVPADTPESLKATLRSHGLDVSTYEKDNDNDGSRRRKAVQDVAVRLGDDVLFSRDQQLTFEGIPTSDEQAILLRQTYKGTTTITLDEGQSLVVMDAGSRFTTKELKTILDHPEFQHVATVVTDVLEDVIHKMHGDQADAIERTGLLFDDRSYGVYFPKPGQAHGPHKQATIALNPFEAMIGAHGRPQVAGDIAYVTAVHESLHYDVAMDGPEFEAALARVLNTIGEKYALDASRRIMEAYADPHDPTRFRKGLTDLLRTYQASRGRPTTTPDALSTSGRRAERPADEPHAARPPPPDVRPSREKTVTRDELKKLTTRRGTSLAEERERAVTAGFTVKDEGLLAPAVQKLADSAANERNLVLGLLSPAKVGVAPIAAGTIRAHTAANDQRRARANAILETYARQADTWSDAQGHQFIDVMQGLEPMAVLPTEWQAVATTMRGIIQNWTALLLKHDLLTNYLDHYWPQEWKQESLEGKTLRKLFGRKPVQGPESYRKHRTIPSNRAGRAFGLVEAEPNPFRQLQRKIFEMSQSVKGRDLHADLIQHGLYAYVPATKAKPAEIAHWQRVPDYALGTKYGPMPTEGPSGRLVLGHYYAPPEVVRLIENHLSPGLWGKSVLYDAYKTIGNVSTQVLLGWSSFHAWLTGLESVISKQSVALEALARGEVGLAAKYQAQVGPQGVVKDLIRGYHALHTFYSRDADANDVTGIIGQIVQAGGGIGWSDFEHEQAPAKFMRDLRGLLGAVQRGEVGRATAKAGKVAVHGAMAAFELPTAAIMNHWVPYLKVSAFLDMAELETRRLGPGATMADLRQVLGDAWDAVDDRFGQLRYDNLFWNNSFKQLLTGGFLSVGWQVGSLRGGLGALGQIPRTIKALKGRRPTETGPGGQPRFEQVNEPWLQRNVAWLFSLAVIVGLAGAIYQKLKTGKNPESLKDVYYPRNGETDPSGREERDAPISYWKDYYAWTHHPVTTLEHKLKPALTMLWEAINNENFYGDEIRNPNDPIVQQLWDTVKAEALRSVPISSGNALRRAGADASPVEWLKEWAKIQMIPFSPASAEMERSDAENYLHSLIPESHRTKEQAALGEARRQLRADLEAKKPSAVQEARQKGLTVASIRATIRSERVGSLKSAFQRTTWPQAVKAYDLATPDERAQLKPFLLAKFGRALGTAGNPEARTRIIQQRDTAMHQPIAP